MFRNQDVPGISAIHYALRHVNACAGDAGCIVYIDNATHGAAVHTHSHSKFRMHF
jgi:hypothetical protein